MFYLLVAGERKLSCHLDISFKNCANGIADFWSVGGVALTFTTVSFYSRGFKHNFPVIKSTTLPQNTLLPYNGEHIKLFPNLHSIQKVRMTDIIKLFPLTWPSVVIFGHRHIFLREGNVFSRVSHSVKLSVHRVCPYVTIHGGVQTYSLGDLPGSSPTPYPYGYPLTLPQHPPDMFTVFEDPPPPTCSNMFT